MHIFAYGKCTMDLNVLPVFFRTKTQARTYRDEKLKLRIYKDFTFP